ncbi:MAG TPA: FliM/FliN family flagellar motor switch protein [Solirubrobacteraceae bacterium]
MTGEEALLALAAPAAEAVGGVLEDFCPGAWTAGEPSVAADASAALAGEGATAFVADYGGGSAGAAAVVLTPAGLQRLAGVLMGGSPDEPVAADAPLSDLQSSAVEEAMGQLVGAAAAAVGEKLGVSLAAGRIRALRAGDDALGALAGGEAATLCEVEVCGQPGWFVQVLPESLVERVREAPAAGAGPSAPDAARAALAASLRTTTVRVSAEVGRTQLPAESLVGVPAGTVIELDRDADDPIDIYVNGRRYATGRLVLTETGEWAVRIERVLRDG